MMIVGLLVALVLFLLAGLHVYWAFGGIWPGTDQASCARAVAGFKGIDRMPPPLACLVVALALSAVAVIALGSAGIVTVPFLPDPLLRLAATGAAIVFLIRGAAGFTAAWRRLTPEMPFARNDRRWFSPLCLAIGAGMIILVVQHYMAV